MKAKRKHFGMTKEQIEHFLRVYTGLSLQISSLEEALAEKFELEQLAVVLNFLGTRPTGKQVKLFGYGDCPVYTNCSACDEYRNCDGYGKLLIPVLKDIILPKMKSDLQNLKEKLNII